MANSAAPGGPLTNNFEVPSWAAKPPPGLHLDVYKDGKRMQKLMIDEKKCYFFGRNRQLCDFAIDHQSCSRVHTALVWHGKMNRAFLIDLGSTHGTFMGNVRLESNKPQHVPMDSEIKFGASSRVYVIRERLQPAPLPDGQDAGTAADASFLGLPDSETELDNLTEFNTANNRRIAALQLPDVANAAAALKRKRRRFEHVHFAEDECVINPEDIDPSVGRFRNMIETTVIPNKRPRAVGGPHAIGGAQLAAAAHASPFGAKLAIGGATAPAAQLYSPPHAGAKETSAVARLGLRLPNLAPDLDEYELEPAAPAPVAANVPRPLVVPDDGAPKKKKYAKEAWPGRGPATAHLLV